MKTQTPAVETSPEIALYNLPLATIAEWKEQYSGLQITGPEDKTGYTALRTARLFVRGKRLDITKRTQELIEPLKIQIADIKSVEEILLKEIAPLEKTLSDREDVYDTEVEELKQQKLREAQQRISTRINFLISHGCSFNGSAYSIEGVHILDAEIPRMTDDEFAAKQSLVSLAYEIEQKRIADEAEAKREAEVERQRIAAEEKAEREREKLELQKQRDELNAEREKQRIAQEKIDADARKLADEKIQAERIKKAAADKKEAEESAKKKAAEDKKQAEADARLIEAAKPDREKLIAFAASFDDLVYPDVKIAGAVELISEVRVLIGKVQKFINDRAEVVK